MIAKDFLRKRVYAFTFDLFMVVLTNFFLMASFKEFIKTVFFHLPPKAQLFFIFKMQVFSSITLMCLTFAYFSIFYYATNGKTLGKTLLGLKVVSKNEEVTLKESMIRALCYFGCAFFGSFLFALPFIRKDQKSLADLFSKTDVVFEGHEDKTEFQQTLFMVIKNEPELKVEQAHQQEDKAA